MSTINNVYGTSWYTDNYYSSNVQNKKQTDYASQIGATNNSANVDPLQSLVDSGTITEDQETAIKSAIENAIQSSAYSRYKIQSTSQNEENSDPLAELVSNGTITEDQKSAIKSVLDNEMKTRHAPPPPPSQNNTQNSLETSLDSLVSSGTITEDQKSEVLKAMKAAYESSVSQTNSTDSTTKTDPLDALVAAGTITKDQEAAIKSAFEDGIKSNSMPPPPPPKDDEDSFDSILSSLVDNGTITDAQKTSILDTINSSSSTSSSSTSDGTTDSSSSYQAYLNGLSNLISAFQTASNAYETQFEAGQDDKISNTLEVTF